MIWAILILLTPPVVGVLWHSFSPVTRQLGDTFAYSMGKDIELFGAKADAFKDKLCPPTPVL